MELISDSELKSRGFMILVQAFGDVNAERFSISVRKNFSLVRDNAVSCGIVCAVRLVR